METSARLLRLLSLLQMRREWPGPELAERLGVAPRTVRRDVERLRNLGYPVHATPGVLGGYRLGPGASMPPLLLDDDEVIAVALGLRLAAAGTIKGIEENSALALAKIEQVLPSRLRHRVDALHSSTMAIAAGGPVVDPAVLTAVASACRDRETLRFDYTGHHGTSTRRRTEPHRVVSWGRRWYLVAWDLDRDDWRTFRLDRIEPRTPTGPRYEPRDPPDGDIAAYLTRRIGHAMWPIEARVRVHAPAAALEGRAAGDVQPETDATCLLTLRGDSLPGIAGFLTMLDHDFDVLDPPELADHVRALAARYAQAVRPGPAQPPPEAP
ncbi:Predicted DNA-binding transcriptional regulator YafY, contains an HTH and WYL domains [Sinosporangium album]|uniref:Predicted DNA-binding transcriptional regulator YafY, contains an HTH and WYL domains n=1 Tax=Sinosporangium album TaxID=504805 RepID=A0A1G7T105_9ACTN|nr:YafY family protein [Sinosporangium album]SDG28260.1 Predicted DNA-binding transcriptional regulator YafY, contains an HTH and WYL domains [Sinosporangium album]